MEGLRSDIERLEKPVAEKEDKIAVLESELADFNKLYKAAVLIYEKNDYNPTAKKLLADFDVTAQSYRRIPELIRDNNSEIAEIEQSLLPERTKLKSLSDELTLLEKVASGTYMDMLVKDESKCRQTEHIGNGVKLADGSDSERVEKAAAKMLGIEQTVPQPPPPRPKR